jgi:uncharacterized repeat protein (TIGR01451 family)
MTANLRTLTKEKRELPMKNILMPATALAAMKKLAFAILGVALLMLMAAPAWAQDQCTAALPVGTASGCGALITVTGVDGNGNATFFTVMQPNNGNGNPYDGTEDTLVGIVNNSGQNLNSITLTSPDTTFGGLFGFDGDGPCASNPADCHGPTGYEGPDNTFTIASPTSGTVNFTSPILSSCEGSFCNSTWFALEGTPNSLTTVSQTQPTPPGVTTVFNFGPFNFKSTPAATTQNGNQLAITAVPIPPGTVIHFADGTQGTCIPYDNTDGNCRAFDVQCSGTTDCTQGTYFAEFSTAYDAGTISEPGFGKGEPGCGTFPATFPATFTNQIDFFSQTSKDPITKGKSGGSGSCWLAVQNVTYPNGDLSVVNVAQTSVKNGTNLSYGILVLNLGPGSATAVTVTDPVPSGTSYLNSAVCFTGAKGVTCQSGTNSPCTASSGFVTCQLGNLLPFSLKTLASIGIQLTFNVSASSGQTITNTATVGALNPDPRMGNNTSTAKTKVK